MAITARYGHYGQVWPLRPACSQNRAGSYNYSRSDFPHPLQFRFSKEGMDHTKKTKTKTKKQKKQKVLSCQLTYQEQAVTNAEAWFNIALRPRKPEGSLGRTAQTATSTLTQLLNYEWGVGKGG